MVPRVDAPGTVRPEEPHGAPQAPSIGRTRSRRQVVVDTFDYVRDSVYELSRKRGGSSPENPGSVNKAFAHAALKLGSVGTTNIIHGWGDEERRKLVLRGTEVFVQQLENIIQDARSEREGSILSRTTTEGGIEVTDDANSEHGINPIIHAELNPFDPDSEPYDPEDIGSCIEDIEVLRPDGSGKLFMRALLDTGMMVNAINEEKATQIGFTREDYKGLDLVTANGQDYHPCGQISFQFWFRERQSARTWDVPFVIVADAPFDVAFGKTFIRNAKLFKRNIEALPFEFKKEKRDERKGKESNTRIADYTSDWTKSKQDSQYADRRKGRESQPKPPPKPKR